MILQRNVNRNLYQGWKVENISATSLPGKYICWNTRPVDIYFSFKHFLSITAFLSYLLFARSLHFIRRSSSSFVALQQLLFLLVLFQSLFMLPILSNTLNAKYSTSLRSLFLLTEEKPRGNCSRDNYRRVKNGWESEDAFNINAQESMNPETIWKAQNIPLRNVIAVLKLNFNSLRADVSYFLPSQAGGKQETLHLG